MKLQISVIRERCLSPQDRDVDLNRRVEADPDGAYVDTSK